MIRPRQHTSKSDIHVPGSGQKQPGKEPLPNQYFGFNTRLPYGRDISLLT